MEGVELYSLSTVKLILSLATAGFIQDVSFRRKRKKEKNTVKKRIKKGKRKKNFFYSSFTCSQCVTCVYQINCIFYPRLYGEYKLVFTKISQENRSKDVSSVKHEHSSFLLKSCANWKF